MRRPAPPSGEPAPAVARLGHAEVDLAALAREVCRRYRSEFPDEHERYGDAGVEWCIHDNQHILNWAVLAHTGDVDLERELAWLARVLAARDFPVERLVRNLELAAEVMAERVAGDGRAIADDLIRVGRSIQA